MKGMTAAFLGGACITLQSVANTTISRSLGTWQAAWLTQFTGFIMALLILLAVRDGSWAGMKRTRPLYLSGGALAAVIIFSEISAIRMIGVTFSISALLIAQLGLAFLIDANGWFGTVKQKMKLPQFIGLALMIGGIIILKL
ncbi:DMT family transporter [Paenibacillus spiritus]|uniref:DMT family transporter n=1 Tax=Paenibacillus spiritus TaxID=2496557 RepID=A0A5J5G9Y9_9BACL|nr:MULTISPECIES: DMT family transporter [Paenibacillus]KAA9004273.1 DMT family transporter [Paenibacillus spiritus]